MISFTYTHETSDTTSPGAGGALSIASGSKSKMRIF